VVPLSQNCNHELILVNQAGPGSLKAGFCLVNQHKPGKVSQGPPVQENSITLLVDVTKITNQSDVFYPASANFHTRTCSWLSPKTAKNEEAPQLLIGAKAIPVLSFFSHIVMPCLCSVLITFTHQIMLVSGNESVLTNHALLADSDASSNLSKSDKDTSLQVILFTCKFSFRS
jgi:hypothetical protein